MSCPLCETLNEQNFNQREEIRALRSLLEQACRAYAGEYGTDLSKEALDNILLVIGRERLKLDASA